MGAGGDGGKVSGANDIQNLERVRQVWGVEAFSYRVPARHALIRLSDLFSCRCNVLETLSYTIRDPASTKDCFRCLYSKRICSRDTMCFQRRTLWFLDHALCAGPTLVYLIMYVH